MLFLSSQVAVLGKSALVSIVLLSDPNYIKLKAKQNKTALSRVGNAALCPEHAVQKQGQMQASILFRSSSNFNPLLEANY